jgi:hypothetical protein
MSRRRPHLRRWTRPAVAAVLAVFTCGGDLPEHAAPRGSVVDTASMEGLDLVPYRMLVRDDFRGTEAPAPFAGYTDQIGAATCGYILPADDMDVVVRSVASERGDRVFQVVPNRIRFEARMDRNCSWWNPRDLGVPEAYILEHEQIHFALFELEARRLNRDIDEVKSRVAVTVRSLEDAGPEAQKQLAAYIEERMAAILARSRRFDEETSMGYEPEQQKRWWKQVDRELAESHQ